MTSYLYLLETNKNTFLVEINNNSNYEAFGKKTLYSCQVINDKCDDIIKFLTELNSGNLILFFDKSSYLELIKNFCNIIKINSTNNRQIGVMETNTKVNKKVKNEKIQNKVSRKRKIDEIEQSENEEMEDIEDFDDEEEIIESPKKGKQPIYQISKFLKNKQFIRCKNNKCKLEIGIYKESSNKIIYGTKEYKIEEFVRKVFHKKLDDNSYIPVNNAFHQLEKCTTSDSWVPLLSNNVNGEWIEA